MPHTVNLQDTEDLAAGDALNLSDTVRVTEDDANLRRGETLAGELADLILKLLRRNLEPRGSRAAVGQSRAGNTLAT